MVDKLKSFESKSWFEFTVDSFRNLISSIITQWKAWPSDNELLFQELIEWIEENTAHILSDNRELWKAFQRVGKSLTTAKKYNSFNITCDTIDFLTFIIPTVWVVTALLSIPGFTHKILVLRKRLKKLETLLNELGDEEVILHQPWYLEEISEILETIVEVFWKVILRFMPLWLQAILPLWEIWLALNYRKNLLNTHIEVMKQSEKFKK